MAMGARQNRQQRRARTGLTLVGHGKRVQRLARSSLGTAVAAFLLLPVPAAGRRLAAPSPEEGIEVVASRAGFKPKLLKARKGESLRLLLKTADDEHCFALDALRVEKRIVPGRTTTLDLTPDRAGEFPFYCCLEPENETLRGRLVVAE